MSEVGIVGFGQFGRALGSVLDEAGLAYVAYDPRLPPSEGVAELGALTARAELVVLAVPVPLIPSALSALRPHLGPDHVVMDVGSVKMQPTDAMAERLGAEIPWVATHPLFGPTSLALGERPLDVVVCPNPLHEAATRRVISFWRSLDCRVIEQDAETHDRVMASTHALTYFVAKGLLDAGAGEGAPYSPPSFRAIARTLDLVRSDAGHLFAAINRENPFAAELRRRLIDALEAADGQLREVPDAPPAEALSIPALVEVPPALRETRDLIDELDRELIELLARRAKLSRRAGLAKAGAGRGVRDPEREAALLRVRRAWGKERGVDASSVDEIFDAVLRFSRRVQGGW